MTPEQRKKCLDHYQECQKFLDEKYPDEVPEFVKTTRAMLDQDFCKKNGFDFKEYIAIIVENKKN